MPDLDFIRSEIERMRRQVGRQRKEILQLQRAGIATLAAEALLQRMLVKIEGLCSERDRLKVHQPQRSQSEVLGDGDGEMMAGRPRPTINVRRGARSFR
jgi:hypothetical protein